ncbi:hypothetical protein LIER_39663 [Lithospermum erythrorhizon]|uniref:Reverse transcriptase domain-containing protein n=1 Tax=Lithospermum erythrorhizon TaxID=34254 RepID=A0AAV3QKX4_LITER
MVPCLAFADDVLVFTRGSKSSLDKVMKFLDHYQTASGQVINRDKSSCILSNKATVARCSIVLKAIGFRKVSLPFTYLGIPIYKGKKQTIFFDDMMEKIKIKLASWSSNFLSYGGRITLLQSVLTAPPYTTCK